MMLLQLQEWTFSVFILGVHGAAIDYIIIIYSGTSEQRTLWGHFGIEICPLEVILFAEFSIVIVEKNWEFTVVMNILSLERFHCIYIV